MTWILKRFDSEDQDDERWIGEKVGWGTGVDIPFFVGVGERGAVWKGSSRIYIDCEDC